MATAADKAKLAEGAKKIKKAQKEAEAKKVVVIPVEIDEVKRDIREILADRVTPMNGNIGVTLHKDTTLGETLRIMDWATTMSDHVGFVIGDIINFGQAKWGDKYQQAMAQTGRAYDTLVNYASVARRLPADKRVAALSFSHHRDILRIGDEKGIEKVLTEVGEQASKGIAPNVKQLRERIVKLTPRKGKKTKKGKPTSGKHTRRGKKVVLPPPYQPTQAEQGKLDEAEIALEEAGKLVPKLLPLIGRLSEKDKNRWLKLSQPFAVFYKNLENITGYDVS